MSHWHKDSICWYTANASTTTQPAVVAYLPCRRLHRVVKFEKASPVDARAFAKLKVADVDDAASGRWGGGYFLFQIDCSKCRLREGRCLPGVIVIIPGQPPVLRMHSCATVLQAYHVLPHGVQLNSTAWLCQMHAGTPPMVVHLNTSVLDNFFTSGGWRLPPALP